MNQQEAGRQAGWSSADGMACNQQTIAESGCACTGLEMCAGRKACTDFAAGDVWTPVDPIGGCIAVNIGEHTLPGWGLVCLTACWVPPSITSRQACLYGSVSHVIVPSKAIRRKFCLNQAWLSQEFSILFHFVFEHRLAIPGLPGLLGDCDIHVETCLSSPWGCLCR